MLARVAFAIMQWKARHGLQDSSPPQDGATVTTEERLAALRTGVRVETYAYW
jgi:hypothetical protein